MVGEFGSRVAWPAACERAQAFCTLHDAGHAVERRSRESWLVLSTWFASLSFFSFPTSNPRKLGTKKKSFLSLDLSDTVATLQEGLHGFCVETLLRAGSLCEQAGFFLFADGFCVPSFVVELCLRRWMEFEAGALPAAVDAVLRELFAARAVRGAFECVACEVFRHVASST